MYKRKETIGNCVLYLGDCLEVMPLLGKVDAVVTDPPYIGLKGDVVIRYDSGVAPCKGTRTIGDPWKANLDWVPLAWSLADRAFFSFCSFHFLAELRQAVPAKPAALLSWYQRNSAPSAMNAPQFKNEFCWAFRKESGLDWRILSTHIDIPRLQAGCMATERIIGEDNSAAHPTQKPIAVMKQIISIGINSALDPFMGSGTTLVACAKMGRKGIGIEIDEKYFDIACRRVEEAYSQPDLFIETPNKAKQEEMGL